MPAGDGENTASASVFRTLREEGSQVLRRLLEGEDGFNLSEIGNSITSLDELRQKLDDLDGTPDNVTYTDVGGVIRFDAEVQRTLAARPILTSKPWTGRFNVGGTMKVSADVTMHLVFGTDSQGFFIDASGGAEPLLTVKNISITGDVDGGGEFGFLEVDLKNATLTVDPSVKLSVHLQDPGPIRTPARRTA